MTKRKSGQANARRGKPPGTRSPQSPAGSNNTSHDHAAQSPAGAARPADSDTERSDHRGPSKPAAGLYLAATPIGNLGDVTHRVLDLARAADVIACEDTRVTGRLLQRYGIDTPLVSYYEHNAAKVRPRLLKRLRDGDTVVLMSDAGTPLVSDPGFRLVAEAIEQGTSVQPLPGPSALLAALQVSGLPSDRFLFAGFLPPKSAARRRELTGLKDVPATLLFYESPRRLAAALADMAAVLGDRPAAVARELTKLHEEVRRAPLQDLAADYGKNGPPKGEIVIVVGPPKVQETSAADLDALLETSLDTLSVREAVAAVTEATGLSRRTVYERALALSARRAADSAS